MADVEHVFTLPDSRCTSPMLELAPLPGNTAPGPLFAPESTPSAPVPHEQDGNVCPVRDTSPTPIAVPTPPSALPVAPQNSAPARNRISPRAGAPYPYRSLHPAAGILPYAGSSDAPGAASPPRVRRRHQAGTDTSNEAGTHHARRRTRSAFRPVRPSVRKV